MGAKETLTNVDFDFVISFAGILEICAASTSLVAMILCVVPYQSSPEFAFMIFASLFGWVSAVIIFLVKLFYLVHPSNTKYQIYVSPLSMSNWYFPN